MSEQPHFETAEKPEDVIPFVVADHVVKLIVGGTLPDGRDTGNPDLAIDGIIMALAMVMEQAPEFPTPRALRKGSQDFGSRLNYYARSFRASFEECGVHMIDHVVDRFRRGEVGAVN